MADKRQYKIMERDPYLANYAGDIELRMNLYKDTKKKLVGKNGKLTDFANGHKYYGFHPSQQGWGLSGMGAGRGRDGADWRLQPLGSGGFANEADQ